MYLKHDKASMNFQRRMLSLMGLLLPVLAPLLGFIAYDRNAPDFWWSISATFYATSNWLMIGTLAIFSFFLWTYKGYDIGDDFTTKLSSITALLILVFPCKTSATGPTTGILDLPTNISHVIHCIDALMLFGSFAYMIGCRFTKTGAIELTDGKKRRNTVYRICATVIVSAMLSQAATSILGIGWMTIVNEAIMLWAFSFAWAVKSGMWRTKFGD